MVDPRALREAILCFKLRTLQGLTWADEIALDAMEELLAMRTQPESPVEATPMNP